MRIAHIYFLIDKRNGKTYQPVGDLRLQYSEAKVLYAIFKDVDGNTYDIPYNQLRICKLANAN